MSKIKAIIKVPVADRWVNVAFLLAGFSLKGKDVKVEELVDHDEALLREINIFSKSRKKEDKERVEELMGRLKVSEFVAPYVESGSKSAIFKIVDDREAAEVTVEESKYDLQEAIAERDKRIAELEAAIAEANFSSEEDEEQGKEE